MGQQQISDDGLARIILKIVDKNQTSNTSNASGSDMNIEGLNNIHPMYEALIALLRQQISDKDIVSYFSRTDGKEDLKSLLLVDTLMEMYKKYPAYTSGLKNMLLAGKPLDELTNTAALLISENKRTQDGKILQDMGRYSKDKFMMRALRRLNPPDVYVKVSDINKLKQDAGIMRHNRNLKAIAWGLAAGALALYISYQAVASSSDKRVRDPASDVNLLEQYDPSANSSPGR